MRQRYWQKAEPAAGILRSPGQGELAEPAVLLLPVLVMLNFPAEMEPTRHHPAHSQVAVPEAQEPARMVTTVRLQAGLQLLP
jgi:hypothetical protein